MLSGMNTRSDFAESSLDVHVMVGNETMLLKDLNETFNTIGKNGTSYRWNGAKLLEVGLACEVRGLAHDTCVLPT